MNNEILFGNKQLQDIIEESLEEEFGKDIQPEDPYVDEKEDFKLKIPLLDLNGEDDAEDNTSGLDVSNNVGKHDTRKDVLFKNVFRTIKKFYTNFFK